MSLVGDALERFIESMIFFPDRLVVQTPSDYGVDYEEVWFDAADGVHLHGWMVPSERASGLWLFCHGNAGNICHRLDNIFRLNAIGLSVFIFDYRGYGKSAGRITEKGFYLDSEAAYQVARSLADREKLKLVLFGRSLGGIAAVHIASANPCSGVILESTFTNLAAMARTHFPIPMVDGLLEKRLNSIDKIRGVKAPLLFFHGDADDIVPFRYGLELFEAAPEPKEFVALPGAGHNDTYIVGGNQYFQKIKDFVASLP